MKKVIFFGVLLCLVAAEAHAWGFFAHRRINRLAVFTLPPEMVHFYKTHIQFLTENAVNPDRRRYAVEGEAPRHFIDVDIYGDSAAWKMPKYWKDAVAKYTEDTLQAYGIVPWHIEVMKHRLTRALHEGDVQRILLYSADIGHYIGDANVPLHTTENYNGQLTGQYGIHGFWESRLPELFSDDYDFFLGQASYVEDTQERAWEAVRAAHTALDSVLRFERELTERMGEDRKFAYETRGRVTVRTYSQEFSRAYHRVLGGQVERRMRAAVRMVGDIWYTCWVDAGQPDLNQLIEKPLSEEELQELEKEKEKWRERKFKSRDHESKIDTKKQPRYFCYKAPIFRRREQLTSTEK